MSAVALRYGNTGCGVGNWVKLGRRQKLDITENKVILKLMLSKNVNNKKCARKLILFNEKKIEKDLDNF